MGHSDEKTGYRDYIDTSKRVPFCHYRVICAETVDSVAEHKLRQIQSDKITEDEYNRGRSLQNLQ